MKRPTKQKGNNEMHSGLNPQGYSEDKADQEPKSQLEQKAKHSHTKR
ncbi:small, acid-soluble spore protein L [Paraliobacillus sediminis]